MDPLTALGLASNVVALVGATYKGVTVCNEIYTLGASANTLRVTETSYHLQKCTQTLESSLSTSKAPDDLSVLGQKCSQTAQQISNELEALQGGKSGRRATVVKFVRTKLKAGRIDRLKVDLDEYQKVINTRILIDMRHSIQWLSENKNSLNASTTEKLASVTDNIESYNAEFAAEIRRLIESLLTVNADEHVKTRQHVDNALASSALSQAKIQHSKEEKKQMLSSLHFEDMNLRANEVDDRHAKTFEWIFEEVHDRQWSPLKHWLTQGEKIYWIYGSPGSGKSTLMKFIMCDERTTDCLDEWSGKHPCVVLRTYFWLAGSKLQRSMKGFLCSLLYQILDHEELQNKCFEHLDAEFKRKRSVHDWSTSALRSTLDSLLALLTREHGVCIFVDGLDEFDQDDDRGKFLDFLNGLARHRTIKLCISSRPEFQLQQRLSSFPKLCLHDLTRRDMQLFLEDELTAAFVREQRPLPESERFEKLVEDMLNKAEGVFLWVHYAMQSIRRGIGNQENNSSLEDRLQDLPAGMSQLYENMWQRLNGDQNRYREEASGYLQLALAGVRFHSTEFTLLATMFAARPELRKSYLTSLEKMSPKKLRNLCDEFQTAVETRCAGLLKCKVPSYEKKYLVVQRRHSLGSESGILGAKSLILAPDVEQSKPPMKYSHQPGTKHAAPMENLYLGKQLGWYESMQVSFLHRTARDFLQETKVGRAIADCQQLSYRDCLEAICESRVCIWLHNLETSSDHFVGLIHIGRHLESDRAATFYRRLEVIGEMLIADKSNMIAREDLYGRWGNFTLALASTSPYTETLRLFLDSNGAKLTPIYLAAVLNAGLAGDPSPSTLLSTCRLLWQLGADMRTKLYDQSPNQPRTPLESLTSYFLNNCYQGPYFRFEVHTASSVERLRSLADIAKYILYKISKYDVFTIDFRLLFFCNQVHSQPRALRLEIGADWLFRILSTFVSVASRVTKRSQIDPTEMKIFTPPQAANQTAKLIAFGYTGLEITPYHSILWIVPSEKANSVAEDFLNGLAACMGTENIETVFNALTLGLREAKLQSQIVDERDWKQMMRLKGEERPADSTLRQATDHHEPVRGMRAQSRTLQPSSGELRYGVLAGSTRPRLRRRASGEEGFYGHTCEFSFEPAYFAEAFEPCRFCIARKRIREMSYIET